MKMKLYKNVELPKDVSNELREFLKSNKIKYETSEAHNLIHFECLVNKFEEQKINNFLDTLS